MVGRRSLGLRARRWATGAAVVALLAVAAVLTVLALNHTDGEGPAGEAAPAPTFTLPSASSTSPTSGATSAPAFDAAEERFLVAGSESLWRGVSGSCDAGDAVVELSADGGESWEAVTPWDPAARQLLALELFMGDEAQLVAAVGDDCEPTGIRTFTQAVAWAENPNGLAGLTYIDPAEPGSVVIAGQQIETPCESPHSLRAGAQAAGVICDDVAYALDDEDSWLALEAAEPVALATAGESLLVAHTDATCDGLAITRFAADGSTDATAEWCAEGADRADPAAIAAQGDSVLVWWGEIWLTLSN